MGTIVATVFLAVFVVLVVAVAIRSVRIVPQATAAIVERFGRYHRTMNAGLNVITPFIDRVRPLIDLREQVISFPVQPVITMDNLVVGIDTIIYCQVTDPRAATYEISSYLTGVEQLTLTTLRNVVGGMDLETTLTSRDQINSVLRTELDEATGKWGLRVSRVELRAIEPPASIQDSMEKQMRADRDKRAAILSAEGSKQSAILTAEGERQAAVLRARGESEAVALRAEGEAKATAARALGQAEAITTVFQAIHDGNPDQRLLAYQYMQMLPQIAQGDANKVWIVPSEIGRALEGIGSFFGVPRDAVAEPGEGDVPDTAITATPVPAATPVPPPTAVPPPTVLPPPATAVPAPAAFPAPTAVPAAGAPVPPPAAVPPPATAVPSAAALAPPATPVPPATVVPPSLAVPPPVTEVRPVTEVPPNGAEPPADGDASVTYLPRGELTLESGGQAPQRHPTTLFKIHPPQAGVGKVPPASADRSGVTRN